MIQLIILIAAIIFFAMVFFTLGYFSGKKNGYDRGYATAATDFIPALNGGKVYKTAIAGENINKGDMLTAKEVKDFVDAVNPPGYPKDGLRSTFTIDEPSGPIYRPTQKELKKMQEDDITRANKEAVAEVFSNEKPPEI